MNLQAKEHYMAKKFDALDEGVLDQVADEFGVDFEEGWTAKQKVAALVEDGVTWEMYKQSFPDIEDLEEVEKEEEPVVVEEPKRRGRKPVVRPEPTVLLKMERANPKFEIRGYSFTKAHPFLPVTEDDAAFILNHEEGFRIALPREVEEFYS